MEKELVKKKKVGTIILNVILSVIFVLSLATVIMTLNSKTGVPNLFGIGLLSVQSDSMEPIFYEGDLIVVTTTNANSQFEEDDIVTFTAIISGEKFLNTHRIINVQVIGETRVYTTQGDNTNQQDTQTITSGDIVAKYTGVKLKYLGFAYDFIQSSVGFLIVVLLPLAALFVYQIVSFSMLLSKFKKDSAVAVVDLNSLDEEQKAEIARQYLKQLQEKEESEKVKKQKEEKTIVAIAKPQNEITTEEIVTKEVEDKSQKASNEDKEKKAVKKPVETKVNKQIKKEVALKNKAEKK